MNMDFEYLKQPEEQIVYYEEPKEKIYTKYFENTAQLKNYFKNEDYIINLIDSKKNIIGRNFLKKGNISGYEEYFLWKEIEFFSQLSKNITFLFPPKEGKNIEKLIGYRFYEKDPTQFNANINYFTLVLKVEGKYDILEINSSIKDNNGQSFVDLNLNCYDIMKKIIKDRFKDSILYEYPCTSIELFGFYYSLMHSRDKLNICKNIKLIEPFFPIFNNGGTMIEAIHKNDISNNKLFIEPIFFNKHVSVLYFKFENGKRINLLIDPSLYHLNIITKDNGTFPKSMKIRINIIPKLSCQSGASCSIWFISQILVSLKYGNTFFNQEDEFNYINLIRIVENINKIVSNDYAPFIEEVKENNIQPNFFNISLDERCMISHKIAFASFLNIYGFIINCGIENIYLNCFLDEIKAKFEKLRNFICNVKMSKEYYDYIGKKSNIDKEEIDFLKDTYEELKKEYNNFIESFLKIKGENREAIFQKYNLKKNIIHLLDKTLNEFQNKFSWNIYEKEQIRDLYREKNNFFLLNN